MSKILGWGECEIFTRLYNGDTKGTEWHSWGTPVENSTTLDTTEGTKTEAKVEGGENEAVRKAKNTYALSYEKRIGGDFAYDVDDNDGVIDGIFEVLVIPTESKDAPALYIAKANASATGTYNSADGIKQKYTFDALKNGINVGTKKDKPIGQVTFGNYVMTGGKPTSFTAFKDDASSKTNLIAASVGS